MKLLMLTRYEQLGASSRMRFYQYLPWLREAGISVTIIPFFPDAYVRDLQRDTRKFSEVFRAYLRRIWALVNCSDYDLLWIEKETLPWLPAWFERVLLKKTVPYVLDYDDAVFHLYDQHRNPAIKALLSGKHPALMKGASLVTAGNQYLADFARRAGAVNVSVLPTVIDLERYQLNCVTRQKGNTPPVVGWIGQRVTARFLEPYKNIFRRFLDAGLGRFSAIGIDADALGLPMTSIAWSDATEVASLASFDIGIMPLVDEPFERGKCGYKLIQYMACGLPVVASPVGVNCQIVEHGVNGFLADTPQQWEEALQTLLLDRGLRDRMGQAGRRKVERQYSIQQTAPMLAQMLIKVAKHE